MTKFNKDNFTYSGGFLTYFDGVNRHFVARFKHVSGDKAPFLKFLIANFTVEEYFGQAKNSTPLEVLKLKGFVLPRIKKFLASA